MEGAADIRYIQRGLQRMYLPSLHTSALLLAMAKDSTRKSIDSAKDDGEKRPSVAEVYSQLGAETDIYEDGSVDPVYQAKARLLNHAIQQIGMGKYQARVCPVTRLVCI